MMSHGVCELCREDGGTLLYRDDFLRVVAVEDAHYPGFTRVILNRHVAEMSDLDSSEQQRLLAAVLAVERAVRQLVAPDKINLASLGNVVPHLHWHIIPRWRDDRHFPTPIWGAEQRSDSPVRPLPPLADWQAAIRRQLPLSAD